MKKIISIVLVVMMLSTGCSLIGHKEDINGDEPIIPVNVQNEANDTSNPAGMSTSIESSPSTSNVSQDSSSEINNPTSEVTSSQIIIDNGAGEGVMPNASDKNSLFLTLYYRNEDGLLVPVTRLVNKQEGLAKAAISGLADEAITREQLHYYGLYPVLPGGTKIKGINIKNKVAVIDFSKEFLNLDTKLAEQMAIASVVYTLTGFNTVSDVSIRIEGKQLDKLKNGTDLSKPRNRNNTFINSEEAEQKTGYIKCDAYFVANGNEKFNYLVPVSLQVEEAEENQIPVLLFDEMNKRQSSSQLFTSIPEGTKLLSYDKQNDLAILDFSSNIKEYSGTAKEDNLLSQVYYTINQIQGVNKVKILIDGKEATLPEGTEVATATPLTTIFNKVID